MTFRKKLLAQSTLGEPIPLTTSSSPGNLIHTAIDGYVDSVDEIWLYGANTSGTDAIITVEFGNTANSSKVQNTVQANSYKQLVPGVPLRGGVNVRAYTDSPNDVNVFGFVNEIGPPGWTQFSVALNAQVIYVSSSEGSDGYDGLSESTAKATVAAGISLLRDGYADHIRFKRGDTWTDENISISGLSGESATRPMVFESYGSLLNERPLFRTGVNSGITLAFATTNRYLAFQDLDFTAHNRDPEDSSFNTGIAFFDDANGISGATLGSNWLFEGCRFSHYGSGATIQTLGPPEEPIDKVRINRCAFLDGYKLGVQAYGIYAFEVDNLVVEDCILDFNSFENGSLFAHNLSVQNGSVGANTVIRNNIFSRGDGLELQEGGTCTNNLFVRTWEAITVGVDGFEANAIGVPINAQYNVILDGYDINNTLTSGVGFRIGNIDGYSLSNTISNNLLINNSESGAPIAFSLSAAITYGNGVEGKLNNLTLDSNIAYNWRGGSTFFLDGYSTIDNLVISNNVARSNENNALAVNFFENGSQSKVSLINNRFWSIDDDNTNDFFISGIGFQTYYELETQLVDGYGTNQHVEVTYSDSTRSVARYNSEVLSGVELFEDFVATRRDMRKGNWDTRYSAPAVNRWIRAGFTES